jgi:uncharacterized membrane protein YbhN (UPF0104 family)
MFASFTAFAFSNNVGFQIFSGGSLRYRIYSRLGLEATEIGEVVGFCTLTYVLGIVTVLGLLTLFDAGEIAPLVSLPSKLVVTIGAALLSVDAAYFVVAALRIGPIVIGRYQLRMPSLAVAAAQIGLASIDAVLAATVMYVLLPSDLHLSYLGYLSIYLIASTISVLSLVPGGLGVFETALILLTVPLSKTAALGVLIVYRLIYFVIPLAVAAIGFTLYEVRHSSIPLWQIRKIPSRRVIPQTPREEAIRSVFGTESGIRQLTSRGGGGAA